MAKIGEMFVELGLKKDKFDRGMKDAGSAPSKLNAAFKGLGIAIAGAFSLAAITAFTKAAMTAWDQQAKADTALLNALKGRKDLQEILLNQASQLQKKTLFEDDAIEKAQTLLKVMGLSVTQITDLLPLLQDFATTTGMDLAQAANLAGKAIGTGTNALGRYGVELDSTMSKTEKANEIMRVFTERYGGQAQAAAKAGASGLQQLNKAWGEIMETIGSKSGPFLSALAGIIAGKALDATSKDNATGLQKIINDYVAADADGRKKMREGFESDQKIYFAKWKKAKDNEDDVNRNFYALQIDYVREALGKIAELEKENAGVIDDTNQSLEDRKKAFIEQAKTLQEYKDVQDSVNDSMREFIALNDAQPFTADKQNAAITAYGSTLERPEDEPYVNDIPFDTEAIAAAQDEIINRQQDFLDEINAITEAGVEQFIGTFADGIASLITGDLGFDDFFKMILGSIGSFLKQMGAALIAYGVAMDAFKKAFANPVLAIIAGVGLMVVGGILSNLAAKGPDMPSSTSGMSSGGGGSYGSGYNGGYGGSNEMTLSAEVSGQDLLFVLERAKRTSIRQGRG